MEAFLNELTGALAEDRSFFKAAFSYGTKGAGSLELRLKIY